MEKNICKIDECGREALNDSEYCLFHKPNKSDKESNDFYRSLLDNAFLEENNNISYYSRLDCNKFVFPPIKSRSETNNIFYNSVFRGVVNFDKAIFEGKMDYCNVKFENRVIFNGAQFKGIVLFDNVHFKEDTTFINTEFYNDAEFHKVRFRSNAWFMSSTFHREARFSGTTFEKYAGFMYMTVHSYSLLADNTRFEGECNFKRAVFKGPVFFIDTYFINKVIFNHTSFLEHLFIEKRDSNGEHIFSDEVSLSSVICEVGNPFDLPESYIKLPASRNTIYRSQRLIYEKESNRTDADRMYLKERRAGCQVIKKSGSNSDKLKSYIEWSIADLSSEYGTNWKRPIFLWVLSVLFVFPILHGIIGTFEINDISNLAVIWKHIYFSILTATTFGFGAHQPVSFLGQVLVSIEAIFGLFVWAIFLTVFSRKYMR